MHAAGGDGTATDGDDEPPREVEDDGQGAPGAQISHSSSPSGRVGAPAAVGRVAPTMPAATVRPSCGVDEQERAAAPRGRVVLDRQGRGEAQGDEPDVVERQRLCRDGVQPVEVEGTVERADRGLHRARAVLEQQALPGPQRCVAEPADDGRDVLRRLRGRRPRRR